MDRHYKSALYEYTHTGNHKTAKEVKEFSSAFIQTEMKRIYENMDTLVDRLLNTFNGTRLIVVGIVKRPWWTTEACVCAKNLEWWLKNHYGAKVVQLNGFIRPLIHLRNDDVHFTGLGNRLYMDKVFSRVVQIWMAPAMHGLDVPI